MPKGSQELYQAIIASKGYKESQRSFTLGESGPISRIADTLGSDRSILEYVSFKCTRELLSNPDLLLATLVPFIKRIAELLRTNVTTDDSREMSCVDALIPESVRGDGSDYKGLALSALCGAVYAASYADETAEILQHISIDHMFINMLTQSAARFMLDSDLNFSERGMLQFRQLLQCFSAFRSIDEVGCEGSGEITGVDGKVRTTPLFKVFSLVFTPILGGRTLEVPIAEVVTTALKGDFESAEEKSIASDALLRVDAVRVCDDESGKLLRINLEGLAVELGKTEGFAQTVDPASAAVMLLHNDVPLKLSQQLRWLDAVLTYQLDSSHELDVSISATDKDTQNLCAAIVLVRWCLAASVHNELFSTEVQTKLSELAIVGIPTREQIVRLKLELQGCKDDYQSAPAEVVALDSVERIAKKDMEFRVYVRDEVTPTLRTIGFPSEALECRKVAMSIEPFAVRARKVGATLKSAALKAPLKWQHCLGRLMFRISLVLYSIKKIKKTEQELTRQIEETRSSITDGSSKENSTRYLQAKLDLTRAKIMDRHAANIEKSHRNPATVLGTSENESNVSWLLSMRLGRGE